MSREETVFVCVKTHAVNRNITCLMTYTLLKPKVMAKRQPQRSKSMTFNENLSQKKELFSF